MPVLSGAFFCVYAVLVAVLFWDGLECRGSFWDECASFYYENYTQVVDIKRISLMVEMARSLLLYICELDVKNF